MISQVFQILKVGFAVMKGIGKLEEQGPKSLVFLERGDAAFEVGFVRGGESIARVGEVPEKFGGEFEMGIGSGSLDPACAHLGGGDPVEGVIELDGVEVLGEIGKGVEL